MNIKDFIPHNLLNVVSTMPLSALNKQQVYELQVILNALNYPVGNLDGILGTKTIQCFAQFKKNTFQSDPELIGTGSISILMKLIDEEKDEIEQDKIDSNQPSENNNTTIGEINWNDFKCPVSKYFVVGEVTHHDTRRIPQSNDIKSNILRIAKELDKVREDWGSAIAVTSWYRPPAINQSVGGAKYSQHLNGTGVDIYPIGKDGKKFEQWLDNYWGEKALGYGQRSGRGFTHLDLRTGSIRWNY